MDLSNLTFDELLDAIRSDSGYQSAQAKKANAPEETVTQSPAIAEESAEMSSKPIMFEPEYTEKNREAEEAADTVEEVYVTSDFTEEPAAESVALLHEEAAGKAAAEVFEKDTVQIFTPPAVPLSLFETEQPEDELPLWQAPDFTAEIYKPITPESDVESGNDEYSSQTPEADETYEDDSNVYTTPLPPEPIELLFPDETEDEEPIKIYTPPKPDPIDFGGFDITADVASLFPDISDEEASDEKPVTVTDNTKTRVIDPIAITEPTVHHEPSYDKTAVVPDVTDEKTKAVPAVEDGKTRAVDFGTVFERPGIVTTKGAYDKTSDLNALPHILPADEFIDGEGKKFVRTGEIPKVVTAPKNPVVRHEEDEQMMLPGFFDKEEIVRVDEDVVEEELKRTRSRKVDSFRLEGTDIDEPVMDDEVSQELTQGNSGTKKRRFSLTKTRHRLTKQHVEFTRPSNGKAVHTFIARKKLMAIIGAAVSGVCSLILLITTAIPAVAERINAGADVNDAPVTYLLSLIFLLVAIGCALPGCISGITCFFNGTGRPNSQTPVIIAAAAALIQNIVALSSYDGEDVPLFSLAATFLLCCCSLGNMLVYSRTMSNFAFLYKQGREGLYSVRSIDNAIDANRVSQNVVMGEADIRYSGKLKFADRFMAYSLSSDSADDLCAKLVPIVAIISAVIGVIGGFVTGSFIGALTVFSGTLCMGTPACALIAANLPLLIENKRLRKEGAMITGYAAAFEYESTNAVAIDASELFPGENCNIHGMKTFNGVRVDDAVLTAASMLIAAGGPISSLFENVIMEHNELLLKVEDLKYEERLGLTGWIRNRRVFVGNRKLLENHNIEIPMSIDESKYVSGDRQIIYLADAGKIAAFFVVSYGRNKKIAEYLRRIENNGINILVRTTDSNINEKFIAKCFDLPLNSVKVVSNTAGEVLKNYAEHTVNREDAKLIHNGTAAAFLHAVSSAGKLCETAGKITTLQTFCMGAGLLLTVLIMIFSGPLSLTALPVCISQLLWIAIAAVLPLFGKE